MSRPQKSVKSIRMTDEDFSFVKQKADESNMCMGTYIVKLASQNGTGVPPEILCRLMAIKVILDDPESLYDENNSFRLRKEIDLVCDQLSRL